MSQALQTVELPPEAIALIKEGRPEPKTDRLTLSRVHEEEPPPPSPKEETLPEAEPERPSRAKASRERETTRDVGRGSFVSLSVRVPSEIPDALVRASAERKIKRERPFSQQDITVEALTLWLKKNGYL